MDDFPPFGSPRGGPGPCVRGGDPLLPVGDGSLSLGWTRGGGAAPGHPLASGAVVPDLDVRVPEIDGNSKTHPCALTSCCVQTAVRRSSRPQAFSPPLELPTSEPTWWLLRTLISAAIALDGPIDTAELDWRVLTPVDQSVRPGNQE